MIFAGLSVCGFLRAAQKTAHSEAAQVLTLLATFAHGSPEIKIAICSQTSNKPGIGGIDPKDDSKVASAKTRRCATLSPARSARVCRPQSLARRRRHPPAPCQ